MQRGLYGWACLSHHTHPPTRSPSASDDGSQPSCCFRPARSRSARSLLQSRDGSKPAPAQQSFASESDAGRAFCDVYAYSQSRKVGCSARSSCSTKSPSSSGSRHLESMLRCPPPNSCSHQCDVRQCGGPFTSHHSCCPFTWFIAIRMFYRSAPTSFLPTSTSELTIASSS